MAENENEINSEYKMWKFFVDALPKKLTESLRSRNFERTHNVERKIISCWFMEMQPGSHTISSPVYPMLPDFSRIDNDEVQACATRLQKQLQMRMKLSEGDSIEVTQQMTELIRNFVRDRNSSNEINVNAELNEENGRLSITVGMYNSRTSSKNLSQGRQSSLDPYARQRCLVRRFGLSATARMLLRYDALDFSPGNESGLTVTAYNVMYEHGGARFEAFASPLNSKFLGRTDCRFCSLFPDTDQVFGSLGNFFNVNLSDYPGGWVISPPWSEYLMEMISERVLDFLSESGDCWFLIYYPNWTDSPGWERLDQSEFMIDRIDFSEKQYLQQFSHGSIWRFKRGGNLFVMGREEDIVDAVDLNEMKHRLLQQTHFRNERQVEQDWICACDRVAALPLDAD